MARPRIVAAGVLFAIALFVAGCSDRDTAGSETPSAEPSASATATAGPVAPGIQAILEDVAELRGLEPPPNLDARVIARDDLQALLDSLYTPEDLKWFDDTTTLYRLLGHFREDQDFLSIFQSFGTQAILGLYAPDLDTLWVVVDDASTGFDELSRGQQKTLAHELIHAIQDYNFNLDEVYLTVVEDLDRNLAWSAVIEGDAVEHEELYSQEFLVAHYGGVKFLLAEPALAQTTDIPQSIIRELYFPYTTGASMAAALIDDGNRDMIDTFLANPPAGTALIMHPELIEAGWQPDVVALPDLSDALGGDWERESGGSLGEFNLQNYLTLLLRSDAAENAAKGWGGDHYDVYVSDDASVALFRMVFPDESEAGELSMALDDIFDLVNADVMQRDGYRLADFPSGKGYAVFDSPPGEVMFAIGSTTDAAALVAGLVAEG